MDKRDAFSDYHPAVCFSFFVLALVFCMLLRNPLFAFTSLVFSALYALTIQGFQACKFILAMLPLFVLITVVNPLFVTLGDTVLFTYFGGRPYTLEALAYGACTACIFVAAFVWFYSYNRVMTSDKFTFLFGGLAPAITLTLTMALRLVPTYLGKLKQFSFCRASLGKSADTGTVRERAQHGADLMSQLTTWAFESAVQTADSMKSRGYGVGKRSQFALYRFGQHDVVCAVFLVAFTVLTIVGMVAGGQNVDFYPVISLPAFDALQMLCFGAYCTLLAIPVYINVKEIVLWRSSLLKM